MCKLIAELVGSDEQIVREMISRLERASGDPNVDVRLTSDIYTQAHMKMRGLGLDPHDTTPRELYRSLQNLTQLHDHFLSERLGLNDNASSRVIIARVAHILNRLRIPRQAWVLKPVAAKKLLRKHPPRQLQKLLNYRSPDSLLKREPAEVLLTLAPYTESVVWRRKMHEQYRKLSPGDFETRDITITYLLPKRWGQVTEFVTASRHTHVVSSVEGGALCLLPIRRTRTTGLALLSLLLGLKALHEIRTYGTFFKFHQVQPHFGNQAAEALSQTKHDHFRLAGQSVHWRVLHHYFGNAAHHPEVLEPHVQSEDLAYRKAEAVLYRLEPALHFWHDLDYVGLPQAHGPLSFNLMDNAIALVNDLPYEKRIHHHLCDALWNELYVRYLGQASLRQQLLEQLEERVLQETVLDFDLEFAV